MESANIVIDERIDPYSPPQNDQRVKSDWIQKLELWSGGLTATGLVSMSFFPYAMFLVYLAPICLIFGSIAYRRHRRQLQLLLVHISIVACLFLPTITNSLLRAANR